MVGPASPAFHPKLEKITLSLASPVKEIVLPLGALAGAPGCPRAHPDVRLTPTPLSPSHNVAERSQTVGTEAAHEATHVG